jgi:hypothetical protein
MEFHRQHTTSRHKSSTTLLKEAYLLRCGLRDLKLLVHELAGYVAGFLGGAGKLASRIVGGS